MRLEPAVKRTVAFADGQNLYHAALDRLDRQPETGPPATEPVIICSEALV